MKQSLRRIVLVLTCALQSMHAGYLEFDSEDGTPYKWNVSTDVQIAVDPGVVSSTNGVSNAVGDTALGNAIGYYNAVTGTSLNITIVGDVSTDITNANVDDFLNIDEMAEQTSASDCLIGSDVATADLAVFFDADGSFFSSVGLGTSVLGIASPSLYNSSGDITCAYMMINGAAVDDADELEYIISHELGHALNLVHSQINGDLTTSDPDKVPLMYPFIPSDPAAALTPALKLDDRFSFSYLYAQDEIANGGSIQGTITNRFGEGVLATNVICRDTSAVENAVSWISGAELQGDGAFACGLLPNGDYEVEVSPIETAINIWEDNPPFIATEYYSGTDESFDPDVDDRDGAADVSVSGSAINNINIVLNEDGRLQNNVSVASSIVAGTPFDSSVIPSIHDLEYFFFVPSNARTVTFTLEANDTNDDIDLLVRCGSPFSLATGIVGPLYDQSDPANDQSDVVGVTTSGLETIELTSSSSPSIQECEYHLVLVNYTDEVVGFELTASITGNPPKVILDFTAQNQLQDNGETLVASLTAIAKGDRFVIDDITFTDEGKVGAGSATTAKLYRDDNENGQVDDSDTLLGQTTQISNGEFTIAGVDMYLLDDAPQEFLVTYDLSNTAGPQWWMWLFVVGLILGGCFVSPERGLKIFFIISMLASGISCSSGGSSDYNVKVLQKSDVVATALGFGDAFSIENDAVQSVQDFFAN